MAITRINFFEAKQDTEDQFHAFMEDVVKKVKALPGCKSVRLLRSTENPARLAIVEEWESIKAHQKAAAAIPAVQLRKALDLVAKPPVGEYYQ